MAITIPQQPASNTQYSSVNYMGQTPIAQQQQKQREQKTASPNYLNYASKINPSKVSGTGGGAISGAINSAGANMGFGGVSPSFVGPVQPGVGVAANAGSLTATPFTSVLGAAAIGGFGGGLIANMTGGNTTGGSIGGAVGGAIGSAAAGTATGAAVGSALGLSAQALNFALPGLGIVVGGLAGSLFGKKKPGTAASEFLGTTSANGLEGITIGAKGASKQFGTDLSANVNSVVKAMKDQGIDVSGIPVRGGMNSMYSGGDKQGVFVIGNANDPEAKGENRIYFDPYNQDSINQGLKELATRLASNAGATDFDPNNVVGKSPATSMSYSFKNDIPRIRGKIYNPKYKTFEQSFNEYKGSMNG